MASTTDILTPVQTRLDDETLRRLDEVCEARKRSRSFILGEALEQLLDRESTPETAEAA